MNPPPSTPPSKGMAMIAAYRAERLTQRPVLRTTLRDSHVARRAARIGDQPPAEAGQPPIADVPVATAPVAEPPTKGAASVFAGLVSAVAEQEQEASRPQNTEAADEVPPEAFIAEPETVTDEPQPADPVAPEAPYDPPLAEIGFGPGMLIRLSQLGLHTTSDLAQANAGQLRSELGEISRLVDVDAWIKSARQTSRTAAGR